MVCPKLAERINIKFDNAKQIINRYLDFFKPDFKLKQAQPLQVSLVLIQKEFYSQAKLWSLIG